MSTVDLPADLSTAHALIKELHSNNDTLRGEVAHLKHRLDVMARRMYGRRSELLNPDQLQLAYQAVEAEAASGTVADDEPAMWEPEPSPKKKGARRHNHGRTPLPAHLPRDDRVIEPESTLCGCCGKPMAQIGEETAEQLEYVPASYRVQRTVRPKYACGTCKEGVVVAPAPVSAIARSKAGPGMLAHVAVSKFCDHLPLYRQCEMLAREGLELSDRTLGGWVRQVADVLRPVAQAQWLSVRASRIVCADETTVRFLTPGRKGSKTGYLWAYLNEQREVCFDFTVGRGGDAPLRVLREFTGEYLMTDRYAGYNQTVAANESLKRLACWAHVRRYFYDARATDPQAAMLVLALISRLYSVERENREADFEDESLRSAALLKARQAQSKPALDDIKAQLDHQFASALPKSPMGKALRYALRCWDDLCVYVEDAALPIDNNSVYAARGISGVMPRPGLCRVGRPFPPSSARGAIFTVGNAA